jgi:beta-galactosidase
MFVWCHLRSAVTRLALVLGLFGLGDLAARAQGGRLDLNFNSQWRFTKSDPTNAASPACNDRDWSVVSLPHTFNDTDTFNNFALPGLRGELNQWSGRTWYRKTFVAPETWRGRKVYVEFQAVRQFGEVYLNGERLGICKNGFIPFGFDLTPRLQIGATNVLAVMCDNRFLKNSMPTGAASETANDNLAAFEAKVNAQVPEDVDAIRADQIPWNCPQWHPAMGGIYRDVYLYVTDPLHISLPLYDFLRTEGVYIYATEVSEKNATVHVEIPVENGRAADEQIETSVTLLDRDGKSVARLAQNSKIAAGGSAQSKFELTISRPNLWQPDSLYLYRAVCSVRAGGLVVDTQEIPVGIRTVRWEANAGFFINGKHLRLHGWGQKPVDEWPGLGDAQPDWLHFFTLNLMKEAGANWVRWGHCAGGPAQIQSCNELGLMVEQPGVDGESYTVGAAWKIRSDAFRDMIVYYRDNPSIMIWEGGNQKVSQAHVQELRGIMDQFDSHGGRAYAHRRASTTDAKMMDVCVGTEGGREIARLPVVEGEYDREESPRRVWDDFSPPNFGYPEAKGQTYQLTSEQYAVNEVGQYVHKTFAPDSCGGANWIFSDSTSGGRNTTEVSRASGEVDGVRLPKEAYYVCQAMFRDDPQVHIIGHWNYPAGTRKTIYVASNCGDVELFENGRSLGHGKASDYFLFTFEGVVFTPGELKVVAYYQGKAAATHSLRTAGEPVALRLTAITGPQGLQADGSDVALIDAEAVDEDGERCPTFQKRVDFGCTGPAIWRGGYNSGKPGSINQAGLDLECGINRVAVRSTLQPGTIVVSARCAGLKPASVSIPAHPVNLQDGSSPAPPPMPAVALQRPDSPRIDVEPSPASGETRPLAGVGRYIISFSYSGPTTIVHVEQNVADGKNIFVDREQPFSGLPPELVGADWVQGAANDSTYSAVDLMQMAVKAGCVVAVAHDDRLPSPEWLTRLFQRTEKTLKVNGQTMTIFQHLAATDESLTLGSNTDDPTVKKANSYIVFVSGSVARASARN